jgi:poly-gamma-glutamate synthesis protein (capsule biosynthesis protein)
MVDAGADIILGGHPHVPQGIERYNNGFIIYSLGNFAYHQTTEHSVWKTRSVILKLTLTKDGVKSYEMIPVTCGFQPAVAEGELASEILAHMARYRTISQPALLPFVSDGADRR